MKSLKTIGAFLLCLGLIFSATGCKSMKKVPTDMASVIPNVSVATVEVDGYSETVTDSGVKYTTEDYSFTIPPKWNNQYKMEYNQTNGKNFSFYDAKTYDATRKDDSLLLDLGTWPSRESADSHYQNGKVACIGYINKANQSPQPVIIHYFIDRYNGDIEAGTVLDIIESFEAEGNATFVPTEQEVDIVEGDTTSRVASYSTEQTRIDPSIPEAYAYLLKAYADAFPWSNDYGDTDFIPNFDGESYMYIFCDTMDEIGYYMKDLDGNGSPELLIGEVQSATIYDAYTLKGDTIIHLFDSGERFGYQYCSDGSFYYWGSNGAGDNLQARFVFDSSGEAVVMEQKVHYDYFYAVELGRIEETDQDNAYFFSTSDNKEDYIPIDAATAESYIDDWSGRVITPAYKPLSSIYI